MSGLLFRKAFKGSRVSLCLFPSSQLPAPSLHGSLFIISQVPNNLSLSDASEFHTMSLSFSFQRSTHIYLPFIEHLLFLEPVLGPYTYA